MRWEPVGTKRSSEINLTFHGYIVWYIRVQGLFFQGLALLTTTVF